MSEMEELSKIEKEWSEHRDHFYEFAQGPSDFQIEVFMARGEGPPEFLPTHSYRHMLAQVRPTLSELRRLKMDEMRIQRKLKDMRAAEDTSLIDKEQSSSQARLDRITNYKKEPDLDLLIMETRQNLEDNLISQKGKRDQYKTMKTILDHIKTNTDGDLTNERLQSEEWKYWMIRLARQAINAADGATSGVGSGNLNSIKNAIEGSPLDDSPHRIPLIPLDRAVLNALAAGDENTIEFLSTDGKSGSLPPGSELQKTRELPGGNTGKEAQDGK